MTDLAKRVPIRSDKIRDAAKGEECMIDDDILLERLLDKAIPEPNSGCWIWTGRDNQKGYGSIWNGIRSEYAHRASYRLHKGDIPEGMVVCHACDVPSCINPDHLWLGTTQDNVRDCVAKGRHVPADISGKKNPKAKLNPEQVKEIQNIPQRYGVDIALARKFGVSKGAISHIRSGRTWKHI